MSQPLDASIRNRALLYTGGIVLLITLLILFLKWRIELPVKPEEPTFIEVELNLPPDPPAESPEEGGGGGGNPVQSVGLAGATPPSEPDGVKEPAKATTEPEEKETVVVKPVVTKKQATAITKTAPTKNDPKKVETPSPPKPKMVMGKTNKGNGTGGDSPDDFNQAGNRGTGWGTGQGAGSGGGTGSGSGGGNGSGLGAGNGPRVTNGNRKIVKTARFDGDLDKATIYARIRVSAEGKGSFLEFGKGSTHRTNLYRQAITDYLQKIQFDPSDQEDIVTVQFNFLVN